MRRITLENLSSVKSLNTGEMAAVTGGGFIGTFPNWYPQKKRCYVRIFGGWHPTTCPPYYPPLH